MVKSMTGAAALSLTVQPDPDGPAQQVQWDLRAVNGRSLDLRFRLPEGLDGLESGLRARIAARIRRGNVSVGLRLSRLDDGSALRVDGAALRAALAAVAQVQSTAEEAGVALRPPTAAEVLHLRGVLVAGGEAAPGEAIVPLLLAQADDLIARLDSARAQEGAALAAVLQAQISRIEALVDEARVLLQSRRAEQGASLAAAVARTLATLAQSGGTQADPGRLEQELALIAVKSDVAEELDRLSAHCAAAHRLLAQNDPAGRQFDFLTQEFNREANTLCAKAQHPGLTRIGLDLKTVIDQMREQVQNLE
jgi:uncharacterized protein (TIGR00255 family)